MPDYFSLTGVRNIQGGGALVIGETDALGIDFTSFPEVSRQMRVTTAGVPVDSNPQGTLTYTSPSVKLTRRASGLLVATNGTTELPFEWDVNGNPQGLLIEEARTNNCLRSSEFDNANYTKSETTVTANNTTAPDGNSTADKITPSTNSANHFLYCENLTTTAANQTFSVYVKPNGYSWIEVQAARTIGFADYYTQSFNVTTGAKGTSRTGGVGAGTSTITNMGNGWYRLTVTSVMSATSTAVLLLIISTADNFGTSSVFTGDGTSGMFYWGAQAETGAFATSPIVTTSATVTRAVDTISLTASGNFPVSSTLGTLYAKFNPINVAAIRYALAQDDDTANEHFSIGSSAAGAGQFNVVDGGAAQTAPLTNGTVTAGAANKVAASWVVNDFAVSTNGTAVSTDVSGTLPTVTKLKFGVGNVSTNVLNGYLQHVVSLPRSMSDAELATKST